jgi:hypothetical protein
VLGRIGAAGCRNAKHASTFRDGRSSDVRHRFADSPVLLCDCNVLALLFARNRRSSRRWWCFLPGPSGSFND